MSAMIKFRAAGSLKQPLLSCAAGLLMILSGCSSLPSSGPRLAEIRDEAQAQTSSPRFELVDVSSETIAVLKQHQDASLANSFGDDEASATLLLGPGDGLSITIWEAGSEPLFAAQSPTALATSSNSARGVSLSEQIIGSDGCISIPFAGRVSVAGLTTVQAQTAIEHALAGKAQKPQVLISQSRTLNNAVTVIGEAAGGTRIPLSAHGERLLEILAAAGGARAATYETQIQLTRAGKSVNVPLQTVLSDARENIRMQAGDLLTVTRQPQTFTAFGASGRNGQISFDAQQINLIEAVAKAGGLQDNRADPRGIFLFRYETPALASQLVESSPVNDARVPVIYRLDLTKAGGYFLAQNFELRDRDMLYVSNAPATQLEKFLQLIGLISQPIVSGVIVESTTHN